MDITDSNLLLLASKVYDNPGCYSYDEFLQDLNRTTAIKRFFLRYIRSGDVESLKIRQSLNHIIIFTNCFPKIGVQILFFKLDSGLHYILKTFLLFLNLITYEDYPEINVDLELAKELRKI